MFIAYLKSLAATLVIYVAVYGSVCFVEWKVVPFEWYQIRIFGLFAVLTSIICTPIILAQSDCD